MPDKTRGERIGRAAFDAREFGDAMWDDLTPGCRADQTKFALAAVRAAYEIDGVGELVEAAEDAERTANLAMRLANNDGAEFDIDGELADIRAAASRVREAMGGGA